MCFTNCHCRYIDIHFCFTGVWLFVITLNNDCKRNWRRGGKGQRKEKNGKCVLVVTRQAVQQILLQRRGILEWWVWALPTIVLSSLILNFFHSQLSTAFVCGLQTSPSLPFSLAYFPAPLGDPVTHLFLCLLQPDPSSNTTQVGSTPAHFQAA